MEVVCNFVSLPTRLPYKGRFLVHYHGPSVIAAIGVAAIGYVMVFSIHITTLALLVCSEGKEFDKAKNKSGIYPEGGGGGGGGGGVTLHFNCTISL